MVKEHTLLNGLTIWKKRSVLTCTLKMVISKEERRWIKIRTKKLDGLIFGKKEINGANGNFALVKTRRNLEVI